MPLPDVLHGLPQVLVGLVQAALHLDVQGGADQGEQGRLELDGAVVVEGHVHGHQPSDDDDDYGVMVMMMRGITMTTNLLQAILGGQRRPNPKGGLIFLRRVSTSMCLILPFPSGSYSAQEVTNSSRWCAPSIDQSLVFQKEFYRVTDM